MKSSRRAWIAAVLVLALSLWLKVVVATPSSSREAQLPSRTEVLHSFLTTVADSPPEEIASPGDESGWRFLSQNCRAAAFPSGPRGSLDLNARRHAQKGDLIAYAYRGELRPTPPTAALGKDVIVHRLTTVFRPANEPGYVVLIYSASCVAPINLPWGRLPAN